MNMTSQLSAMNTIQRCLVLGGGGFLGSHIVNELVRLQIPVRVFDRHASQHKFLHVDNVHVAPEYMEGDFGNSTHLTKALDGCDYCIHLITSTIPKTSNDDMIFDVESNLVGTLNLLKHAHIAGVKKIIYLSSGGTVYGNPKYSPIDEDHPTNPLSSYGVTKLAIEKYLHIYHQNFGIDSTSLRISNPFGEFQRINGEQGAIAVFLGRAIQGLPLEVWGDGSVIRDYIYVKDVVQAIILAMRYQGPYSVFNIGSGVGLSINQIIAEIERVVNRKLEINFKSGRKFDISKSILDISRAATQLSWRPQVDFSEGLQKMATWIEMSLKAYAIHKD